MDFEERPYDFVGESNQKVGRVHLAMASSQTPLVYEVMTPQVLTVPENMSVAGAAKKMSTASIGSLVVVGKEDRPVGIVTETDIVRRVIARGLSPARIKVRYAMASPLVTIDSNTNILRAASQMTRHGVKRLVVLEKGKLVGIITMSDLIRVTPAVVSLLSELARLPQGADLPVTSAQMS